MQGESHLLWWLPGPGSLKQLPKKQEVLKEDFLEMRVEASGFEILGLRGSSTGSGRVFFKPLCVESFCAEESSSFLALHLQALGCYKIRGTCLRHRFISPMYSVFIPSEDLC